MGWARLVVPAGDRRESYAVTKTMLSYGGPQDYCCGAKGITIHPDYIFCTYKDIWMTLLILYSCTWEPFKAAFAKVRTASPANRYHRPRDARNRPCPGLSHPTYARAGRRAEQLLGHHRGLCVLA